MGREKRGIKRATGRKIKKGKGNRKWGRGPEGKGDIVRKGSGNWRGG